LAADLVRHRVAVIAALTGTPAGLAAKGALGLDIPRSVTLQANDVVD
jgi:hypothetical protein